MFCKNCGKEINDDANVCVHCGVAVNGAVPAVSNTADVPNAGLNLLGFCVPLVGLILYLVWKDETPKKAKAIGKWALISVIVWVVILIIYFIIIGVLLAAVLG